MIFCFGVNMDYRVGIVVPTMNRSDFILRMLRFYQEIESKHSVYIGDSSSEEESLRLRREIESICKTGLTVHYFHVPHLDDAQAIQFLISRVQEKFCVYSGDDDLHFPFGLERCAEFLTMNPDYATTSGKSLLYTIDSPTFVNGVLHSLGPYPSREICDPDRYERLKNLSNRYYVTLFSVHRTDEFLKSFAGVENLVDRSFTELLPVFCDIANGKSKLLDVCLFLRQGHERRYLLPHFTSWIASPNWSACYPVFLELLEKKVFISKNEAVEIFQCYLRSMATSKMKVVKRTIADEIKNYLKKNFKFLYVKWLSYKNARIIRSFCVGIPEKNAHEVRCFFNFVQK